MKAILAIILFLDVVLIFGGWAFGGLLTLPYWLIALIMIVGDVVIISFVMLCYRQFFFFGMLQFSILNFFVLATFLLIVSNIHVWALAAAGAAVGFLLTQLVVYDFLAMLFWGGMLYAMNLKIE